MTAVHLPTAPTSIAEMGVDIGVLAPIALKTVFMANTIDESNLSQRMALPLSMTSTILKFLQQRGLTEVTGGADRKIGAFRHSLTSAGIERAVEAMEISGYVGPAPVPLAEYIEQVKRQSVRNVEIAREDIDRGLGHLVLRDETRDLVGQAMTQKRSALLYGASGNGKTSAALGLGQALHDEIRIPYAIEVMREVIQIYDASCHHVIVGADKRSPNGGIPDRRWMVIKRPTVFVAGELAVSHLELTMDPVHKTYEAPVQLKANGGLLILDDFGRQQLDANYLLNRWVTPLERGIDYLSLHSGARFEVPFDVIPVFASNKPPSELADDAFLRRIRYKIEMPSPDGELFRTILRRECARYEVAYDEGGATYLIETYFHGRDLRGCHPRDLVEMIADAATFRGTERSLNPSAIDQACKQYFS